MEYKIPKGLTVYTISIERFMRRKFISESLLMDMSLSSLKARVRFFMKGMPF